VLKTRNEFTLLALVMIVVALVQGCAGAVVAGAAAGGASAAVDRRTVGTIVDDETIEWKARGKLFGDDEVSDKAHISVTSFNNVVLLTGEAPTKALRDKAVELVRTIEKVRRVHNEIVLSQPLPFKTHSEDAWITTKVKTELTKTKGVNPLHVKVVTENGIVYLMGLVTHAEAKVAAASATGVGNVKRVIKIFEYLD